MKRAIILSTLLLFTGMMLPSCGITIVKRQHTRGYYVSTNPRHHVEKEEAEAIVLAEESKPAVVVQPATTEEKQLAAAETPAAINEQPTAVEIPAAEKQNNAAHSGAAKASANERGFSVKSIAEKVPMMKKMDSAVKKMKSRSGAPASDEGLSLLWIVILVLLVLWALGLAGGGWGLGGLINVLLVIALILLILWLLRVI